MGSSITINCELTITPHDGSVAVSNRYKFAASGADIFDRYEHELTASQREIVASVLKAHGEVFCRHAERMDRQTKPT